MLMHIDMTNPYNVYNYTEQFTDMHNFIDTKSDITYHRKCS